MKNCAIAALHGVGRMTKVITTWREHKPCSDDFNRQFSSTETTEVREIGDAHSMCACVPVISMQDGARIGLVYRRSKARRKRLVSSQ